MTTRICSRLTVLLAVAAAAVAAACGRRTESDGAAAGADSSGSSAAASASAGASRVDPGSLGFAIRFFQEIATGADSAKNVFVSPLSAAQALAMAYEGAGGRTREEMARVLGITDSVGSGSAALVRALVEQKDVTLSVANSLWAREGVPFRAEYLERVRRAYRAEVAALDLSSDDAVARINGWVSRETRGKIPQMLGEPLRGDDVLFLLNAVYFKGKWQDEFEKGATSDRPFRLASGERRRVPMMSRTGRLRYLDGDGFRVVRLPYKGDRFALYVFLPDSGSALPALYRATSVRSWDAWMDSLGRGVARDVHVVLPRFTLRYEAELNGPLVRLGMASAFDQHAADLSGMVEREWLRGQNLYISEARQQVFVEVNEEGTEAAGATSVTVTVTSAPPPPVEFVVDRPFLSAIRDDSTGALLFIGQVTDPSARAP